MIHSLQLPRKDAEEHPTKPGFLSCSRTCAGVVYNAVPGGATAQHMESSQMPKTHDNNPQRLLGNECDIAKQPFSPQLLSQLKEGHMDCSQKSL